MTPTRQVKARALLGVRLAWAMWYQANQGYLIRLCLKTRNHKNYHGIWREGTKLAALPEEAALSAQLQRQTIWSQLKLQAQGM